MVFQRRFAAFLFLALHAFANAAVADAADGARIFSCNGVAVTDEARSLDVYKGEGGELVGVFSKEVAGDPVAEVDELACRQNGRGHSYSCKNERYYVTVEKYFKLNNRARILGGFIVGISILGDVDLLDDGYFTSFSCPI